MLPLTYGGLSGRIFFPPKSWALLLFKSVLYGTVTISAISFYDVIFLLKRIILHAGLHVVKNKTVSLPGDCVVELGRARVDS